MTAGQLLHVNSTLAQLPGFDYGVVLVNYPNIYGYGDKAGKWELFERTDVTDPGARWTATIGRFPVQDQTNTTDDWTKFNTANRILPVGAKWGSRDDAIAWLVSTMLTED